MSENLLHYLHEVTLYLDFSCKQNCLHCRQYCKQFLFCTQWKFQGNSILSIDEYEKLFKRLNIIGLKKLNLIVNNFSNNQQLERIVLLLKQFDFSINLCTYYRNITCEMVERICNTRNLSIILFADIQVTEREIQKYSNYRTLHWKFAISSEKEYITIINSFKGENVENIELIPFYNGHNMSFFEENVYTDMDDLLAVNVSKKDIFTRQVLNSNLFGKLIIMPDGEVFSNMNTLSLGNLKELSLNDLIHNEFVRKDSWLLKRDKGVCKECVYRYLCPPLSNYELVMKKFDLCNMVK